MFNREPSVFTPNQLVFLMNCMHPFFQPVIGKGLKSQQERKYKYLYLVDFRLSCPFYLALLKSHSRKGK